jgi:hypothetical protein
MLKVPEELLDLRDQHGIFKDQKKLGDLKHFQQECDFTRKSTLKACL